MNRFDQWKEFQFYHWSPLVCKTSEPIHNSEQRILHANNDNPTSKNSHQRQIILSIDLPEPFEQDHSHPWRQMLDEPMPEMMFDHRIYTRVITFGMLAFGANPTVFIKYSP